MGEIKVKKIPKDPEENKTYSITETSSNSLTHGIFKYPCRYIPDIPRWAIKKYLSNQERENVLDPFAGSGTTLVESNFIGFDSYAVEFDPFSRLLIQVKTTKLEKFELKKINEHKDTILQNLKQNEDCFEEYIPNLSNLDHWFPKKTIQDLSYIKYHINENIDSKKIRNVFSVALGSIVKPVSKADSASPKPYVSKNINKEPEKVYVALKKKINEIESKLNYYSKNTKGEGADIISNDIKKIKTLENKIDLAVTSPPYINAFDYVRCLKLENLWLDFLKENELNEKKKEQMGTEKIYKEEYSKKPKSTDIPNADKIIENIYQQDKKRGHVVYRFFTEMREVLRKLFDNINPGGHFIIVIGKNTIRDNIVDTPQYLRKIAEQEGFNCKKVFSYIIKNRYLNIPRSGRGGKIKKDFIIILHRPE